MSRHLILGTAGHIDHGKTALVKKIAGIDCDTHKEEKRRGITINLGFANLEMPSGDRIGIVDVPGHHDFVHTMVSGASGIDIALLVVAADNSVMPQTREHLSIMQMLGINGGIVALTRIDLAKPEIVETAVSEVQELVKGTFLENCFIVKVSSKTGEGIDTLKNEIFKLSSALRQRSVGEVFRMYIDRIFSVAGFGTIVTGSVLGGKISTGSKLYLLPGERELRVKRIERYGQEVDSVVAGDRASVNISGLSRDEFTRGMLLSDHKLRQTKLLDARLRLFDHGKALNLWSNVIFLSGTHEAQVRIHLLGNNILRSGSEELVQIHLPSAIAVQSGDHFIIRSTSGDLTLGGGEIIDPLPLHHRRRPEKLIKNLYRLARGNFADLVSAEIRKHFLGISDRALSESLNVSIKEIERVRFDIAMDIMVFVSGNLKFFISKNHYQNLTRKILENISAFHQKNALNEHGRSVDELRGMLGFRSGSESPEILHCILDELVAQKKLKKVKHTWALESHDAAKKGEFDARIQVVEKYLYESNMRVPVMKDLETYALHNAIDRKMLNQILKFMVSRGTVYYVEGNYIHSAIVDDARKMLLHKLGNRSDGITVAGFRDLIGGNRKICLNLFAIFDSEGITERRGDFRVLTEKGRSQSSGVGNK